MTVGVQESATEGGVQYRFRREGKTGCGRIQSWAEVLPRGLLSISYFFLFSFQFSFDFWFENFYKTPVSNLGLLLKFVKLSLCYLKHTGKVLIQEQNKT
jgi:hypothetical protein